MVLILYKDVECVKKRVYTAAGAAEGYPRASSVCYGAAGALASSVIDTEFRRRKQKQSLCRDCSNCVTVYDRRDRKEART